MGSDMKKFGILAVAGMASLALGGCVVVDADVHDTGWDWDGDFGYVLGADVSARGPEVSITAHSNGCTNKEDFRPVVRDRGEARFNVGFRRIREDNCKALMPEGRTMTWSFAELGIPRDARVMIMNPVGR
jgi:hypothetical protein